MDVREGGLDSPSIPQVRFPYIPCITAELLTREHALEMFFLHMKLRINGSAQETFAAARSRSVELTSHHKQC